MIISSNKQQRSKSARKLQSRPRRSRNRAGCKYLSVRGRRKLLVRLPIDSCALNALLISLRKKTCLVGMMRTY